MLLKIPQQFDLEGLEEDPHFWGMDMDNNGEEIVPAHDISTSQSELVP